MSEQSGETSGTFLVTHAEAASAAQDALGEAFPDIDFTQMGDPDDNQYFLPEKRLSPEEAQRRLIAAMAENPKVSGRPELANPGEDEQSRRLMDVVDAAMEEVGLPRRQTVAEWKSKASAIMQDPAQRQMVEQTLDQGHPMQAPEHTYAAKQIWNERANEAMSSMDPDVWRRALASGYGWRQSGTQSARVLRARLDDIKAPEERIKEFVVTTLTDPPRRLLGKKKRGETGLPPIETEAMQRYMEAVGEMFQRWKRQGLDWQKIDGLLAANPSIVYRVTKDVQALRSRFGESRFDPIAEIYRNWLMSAPITFIRNMTGSAYAVADLAVTQPMAALLEQALPGTPTRSVRGSFAGATALFSPKVWQRAIRNAAMTAYHEVPVFDLDVDAHGEWDQVEWKKPVAISGEPLLRSDPNRQQRLPQFNNPEPDATMRERARFRASQAKQAFGRTIRTPQLANMVVDQAVKTIHAHGHVTSIAKTNGIRAGLRGVALDRYVRQEVGDMGSSAWSQAVATHQTARSVFQAPASGISGMVETAAIKFRDRLPIMHLVLPFIKTPTQLINESFWHTPGLGAVGLAAKLGYGKATKQDAFEGGRREATLRATQQLLGLAGLAMLWNWIDDDEAPIKVTGAASYAREDRQERLGREVVEPYFSLKLGDKWYSYRNLDPYTVILAGSASVAREMKRA
ncbi:MAG: hypothetical protein ACOC3G_09105, partial [Phycisphaeraceae bacterium]